MLNLNTLLVAIVPVQSLLSPSSKSDISTQTVCKLNTCNDAAMGVDSKTDQAPSIGGSMGLELKQACWC